MIVCSVFLYSKKVYIGTIVLRILKKPRRISFLLLCILLYLHIYLPMK